LLQHDPFAELATEDAPPLYARLPRLVNDHFTPGAIKEMEVTAATIADYLLEHLLCTGEADLARESAWVLPPSVAMALLGPPATDFPFLRETIEKLWQDNRLWIEPDEDAPARLATAQLHGAHTTRDVPPDVLSGLAIVVFRTEAQGAGPAGEEGGEE
jgi:cytochrome P450